VVVPGGTVEMLPPDVVVGSEEVKGPTVVEVDPFEVDRSAATVEDYRRCVSAGACAGEGLGGHEWSGVGWVEDPLCHAGAAGQERALVNCLTREQAAAYCAWREARLPTDPERSLLDRSGRGQAHPQPFCDRPGRDNPFGLCDLGGEVASWAESRWGASGGPAQRFPGLGVRCAKSYGLARKSTGVPAHLVGGVKIIQVRPPD
jgi:formylglycine-generating enzyme required for sulfatase activity